MEDIDSEESKSKSGDGMDTVRDILFGEKNAEINGRIDDVEESLRNVLNRFEQQFESRNEALAKMLSEKISDTHSLFESVSDRIESETESLNQQVKDIGEHIEESETKRLNLEDRLNSLETATWEKLNERFKQQEVALKKHCQKIVEDALKLESDSKTTRANEIREKIDEVDARLSEEISTHQDQLQTFQTSIRTEMDEKSNLQKMATQELEEGIDILCESLESESESRVQQVKDVEDHFKQSEDNISKKIRYNQTRFQEFESLIWTELDDRYSKQESELKAHCKTIMEEGLKLVADSRDTEEKIIRATLEKTGARLSEEIKSHENQFQRFESKIWEELQKRSRKQEKEIKSHLEELIEKVVEEVSPTAPSDGPVQRSLDLNDPDRPGVLVVDDEELMRKLICTLCEKKGYRTFKAKDGREALEIIENHPSEIFAAIVELVMPGMTGNELMKRLTKAGPDIPVIVASALLVEDEEFFEETGGTPYAIFSKPFQLSDLIEKINELRDQADLILSS